MNRSLYLLCAGAFLLYSSDASATQWTVGPGQTYTAPSQVAALVGDGDTVNIQAGTYPSDVTNWTANDLLLRGTGGHAQLASNGTAWGGKGIWVIQGDRTRVEWIEFGECSVPDHNGAGIRMEGKNLTVRHCVFRDNENGILAGTPASVPSNITIEHCEFDHNGYGDGFSHNLYINYTDTLFFRYNYSHHAHVGQELKSRAHVNFIEYNRLSNEATGDASREIDLPDGGQAYLIGNFIQQGPMGQNSNLVGFGAESLSNPGPHAIYAINNTMVNEKNVGSFFSMPATVSFKGYANIMAGGGTIMATGFPNATDTAGNLRAPDIADLNFQSAGTYDYRLFAPSRRRTSVFPQATPQAVIRWFPWKNMCIRRTARAVASKPPWMRAPISFAPPRWRSARPLRRSHSGRTPAGRLCISLGPMDLAWSFWTLWAGQQEGSGRQV
ncbi:MAG: right-handed parallel beta-helix repeat-containing protein [Flavobacteriales bacterium]|nr:right-handed parallel beta-helix repeat-containing protein [Flavobacteriales bacterium]